MDNGVAKGILPDYTKELQKVLPTDIVIKDCVVNLARGLQKMLDATSYDMAFMAPMAQHTGQLEDLGIAYPIRYLALPLKGIEIKNMGDMLLYDVFDRVNYPGWTFETAGIHFYLSKKSPVYQDQVLVDTIKKAMKTLFAKDIGMKIVDKHLGGTKWRE